MSINKYKVLIVIFSLILFGCNKKIENTCHYNFGSFPRVNYLYADTIDVGEFPNSSEYLLVNDSLVLIPQKHSDSCYVDLVNLRLKQSIYQFAVRGLEKDQFSKIRLITDFYNSPIFYIIDKGCFVEINIDSLQKYKNKNHYHKVSFPAIVNTPALCRYDENHFLAQNQYYFEHKRFSNPVDRFIKINLNNDSVFSLRQEYNSNINYYVANVNLCWLIPNNKHNRLWCLSMLEDRIDIYKKDSLLLLRTLKGPRNYKIEYAICENVSDYPLVADRGLHRAFLSAVATDSCIYALFGNRNYLRNNRKLFDIRDKSEILKFDWNGKPLERYILDQYAHNITMDNNKQNFYCTVTNNYSLTPVFVKYKIE